MTVSQAKGLWDIHGMAHYEQAGKAFDKLSAASVRPRMYGKAAPPLRQILILRKLPRSSKSNHSKARRGYGHEIFP